jgi:hypothetical protein
MLILGRMAVKSGSRSCRFGRRGSIILEKSGMMLLRSNAGLTGVSGWTNSSVP